MQRTYVWETYPEYIATQQYSRCLGRMLVTLPARLGKKLTRPLIRGAVMIAQGIAGAHAEDGDEPLPVQERELFRDVGLDMIARSRTTLDMLRAQRHGDRASVLAALELLERAEHGLRTRPIPGTAASAIDV